MKNLKLLSLIAAFTGILFVNNLFGQETYMKINAGYSVNMSSQNLEYFDFYNYNIATNSNTNEQVFVSLGKGLNFDGTIGYMFNENIGAELRLSYLIGGKSTAKHDYENGAMDYTISSNMLRANPSLVLSTGSKGINPYAKFGVIIGTGSVNYKYEDNEDGDIYKANLKMDGGLALGLNAAIGVNYTFNDNMSLFGEINMINMSYAPDKGEITEATYNGTDELPDMTTREKEIDFVDSYTYNQNDPPPESEPKKELKQKLPFGSLGLNLGLRIGF